MDDYVFDVITALHDDLKGGGLATCPQRRVRVLISRSYSYPEAVALAANMAVATTGGMAIEVMPRY